MKTALIFLFGGIILLVVFLFGNTYFRRSSVDILYFDTYYIIDYIMAVLLLIFTLGFLFSIGGVIGTRFKSRSFLILSVLFIASGFIYGHYVANIF